MQFKRARGRISAIGGLLPLTILTVVAAPVLSAATVESRISGSWDDAEERDNGRMVRASSDLEMSWDAGGEQAVGLRFKDIPVPQGATITRAWIQFTVDETTSTPTYLNIQGLTGYVKTFKTNRHNLTSRPRGEAVVQWTPPRWRKSDGAGPAQRTPDLAPIIQELVNQKGWRSGISNIGIIITGEGERVAVSYNGNKRKAPLLHIEYDEAETTVNQPPVVDAGPSRSITLPRNSVMLDAEVTDDGLPAGNISYRWERVDDGGGEVTFDTPDMEDTSVTFSEPGSYRLRLVANDGELSGFDEVTVTVNQIPSAVSSISQVSAFATGQDEDGNWLPVRATDPAGLYIDPMNSHLMVADSEITEIPEVWAEVGANVFETTTRLDQLYGEYDVSPPIAYQQPNLEAAGIAKCETDGHYYIVNDDRQRLYRYAFDGSSMVMVDAVNTFPLTATEGTLDPEGVTCDPEGNIYVAGGHGINILVYRYDGGFALQRVIDLNEAQSISGPEDVPTDPEGIAFDPVSGHLFVMNNDSDEIFEYSTEGAYLGRHSIHGFKPKPKQPQGLSIGPSTRTPGKMSFFIADPRVDNNFDPTERDGLIYEAEIERP